MDLLNLLLSRRSIRRYTESPIPQRALETILAAGLLSPSAGARRPWEFVVVQNPNAGTLSLACQGSAAMLAGAKACHSGLCPIRRKPTSGPRTVPLP